MPATARGTEDPGQEETS